MKLNYPTTDNLKYFLPFALYVFCACLYVFPDLTDRALCFKIAQKYVDISFPAFDLDVFEQGVQLKCDRALVIGHERSIVIK